MERAEFFTHSRNSGDGVFALAELGGLAAESCSLANVLIAITDAGAIVPADKQAQYICRPFSRWPAVAGDSARRNKTRPF